MSRTRSGKTPPTGEKDTSNNSNASIHVEEHSEMSPSSGFSSQPQYITEEALNRKMDDMFSRFEAMFSGFRRDTPNKPVPEAIDHQGNEDWTVTMRNRPTVQLRIQMKRSLINPRNWTPISDLLIFLRKAFLTRAKSHLNLVISPAPSPFRSIRSILPRSLENGQRQGSGWEDIIPQWR